MSNIQNISLETVKHPSIIPGIHRFLIKPPTSLSDPLITLDQAPSNLLINPFPSTYTGAHTFLTGLQPPPPEPEPLSEINQLFN